MSIAERVAMAIVARAEQNGTTVAEECRKIGATRKNYYDWKNDCHNPQAYFLQQMVLAGYDINWILIGDSNDNK